MEELNLETVLSLDDEEAFKLSKSILEGYFDQVYTDDFSYAFVCGTLPLCFTAHSDTLRGGTPVNLKESGSYILNANGILGADDRAGIFMIFRLLSECSIKGIDLPSILITGEEELGMIGAIRFVRSKTFIYSSAYKSTSLILGLDCSGHKRFVTYDKNIPNSVETYIQDFGFLKDKSKRRSDITVLSDFYPSVPCANLSVGYEHEHTAMERLHVENYIDSFQRVLKMVQSPLLPEPNIEKEQLRARTIRLRKTGRRFGHESS